MNAKDNLFLNLILKSHNETMEDLLNAIETGNEEMLCGIYGNLGTDVESVYNSLLEFNFVFENETEFDNHVKTVYEDCKEIYISLEECKKDIETDCVRIDNYIIKHLYY